MLAFHRALLDLIDDLNSGKTDRKAMIKDFLETYRKGSNNPLRGRDKDMEKNIRSYLLPFNE